MQLLLEHGADLHAKTAEGTTALMLAAGVAIFNEGDDAGTEAETLQAVKLLVEGGADVNQIDDNGETAVHGAAYRGHNSVVQHLADHQAKLDVKNRIGWTPVTIADGVLYAEFFKQHRDTAALLRQLLKERGIAVEDAGIVNQDRAHQDERIRTMSRYLQRPAGASRCTGYSDGRRVGMDGPRPATATSTSGESKRATSLAVR